MLTTERRAELIKKFGANEKDCGSTAVQVALLTERINSLSSHFEKNKKDYHSQRGLMQMIGQRRSLLKFLNKTSPEKYQSVIKELGLRK